jgi:DNA-binding CsgD family transcriptional regulator
LPGAAQQGQCSLEQIQGLNKVSFQIPDKVSDLWDDLADFPASETEACVRHLLDKLAQWTGSSQAYWLGTVRMGSAESDGSNGWRPSAVHFLHDDATSMSQYKFGMRMLESGNATDMIRFHVQGAGNFRCHTLAEVASSRYLASDWYKEYQAIRSYEDVLYVIIPINRDSESYYVFSRESGGNYNEDDKQLAANTLKGLKWLSRRMMLHHGLMLADKALTSTERKVLALLVTDLSEKQIAEKLGKKADTTHHHVKSIYRKFSVKSRAALMSLWLGVSNE